jgi:hypothetical protein
LEPTMSPGVWKKWDTFLTGGVYQPPHNTASIHSGRPGIAPGRQNNGGTNGMILEPVPNIEGLK